MTLYALEYINADANIEIVHFDTETQTFGEPFVSEIQSSTYDEPRNNEIYFCKVDSEATETELNRYDCNKGYWYTKLATVVDEEAAYAYYALPEERTNLILSLIEGFGG